MRAPGAVLLLSTYELGHPPHALAMMAGFLEEAGFQPKSVDLATAELRPIGVHRRRADRLFRRRCTPRFASRSRLSMRFARLHRARGSHSSASTRFFTAIFSAKAALTGFLAESSRPSLSRFVTALADGRTPASPVTSLARQRVPRPSRRGIDKLANYSRFVDTDGTEHLAGYTETTRGCLEHCRHCPVPAVYEGRFVAIDANTVLADIAAQVEAGAQHISFGDPDFLNGPTHALRICRQLKRRWPALTFDFVAQVANLLEHREATTELRELGCAFVVTAVESLSDEVLESLGKRHRASDVEALLEFAASIGPQPQANAGSLYAVDEADRPPRPHRLGRLEPARAPRCSGANVGSASGPARFTASRRPSRPLRRPWTGKRSDIRGGTETLASTASRKKSPSSRARTPTTVSASSRATK